MSEQSAQTEANENLVTPPTPQASVSEPQPAPPAERQERLAARLQFPRRIVLLLIAFVLAWVILSVVAVAAGHPQQGSIRPEDYARLAQQFGWDKPIYVQCAMWLGRALRGDFGVSLVTRRPVLETIAERLPNTLLLLGATLFLALILALAASLIAALVHRLEQKAGPVGSILKGLGRLVVFGPAAMPAFVLAVFLMLILAVQLKWLPVVGMFSPDRPNDLGDRVRYLVLPVLTLALWPAVLTTQAVAREMTLPRERAGTRLWLAGLFKMLGTLLGQIGGLLGATVLVETVFAWPGIGRLVFDYTLRRDYPVLLGVLGAYAGLVLIGRLMAEFFRWLERLMRVPILFPLPQPSPWRRKARTIWVIVALALLLAPLALAIAGLTVDQNAITKSNVPSRLQPPSANHPWGTDALGRDVQARVLRGGLTTLGLAVLAAAIVLLPGLMGGALTGWLASRRVWWAESIADVLLLPADVLLFIPAVMAGIVMAVLLPSLSWGVGLMVALALLPRAMRVYQTLWTAVSGQRRLLVIGLAGSGSLFFGALFAGIGLVAALEYAGLGVQPPTPALGGLLAESLRYMATRPEMMLAPGIALWIGAFAFYTAADALVGFFSSKEPLARLNE